VADARICRKGCAEISERENEMSEDLGQKSICNQSAIHFLFSRQDVPEVCVRGTANIMLGEELLGTNPETILIARSLLKPWQFLGCEISFDVSDGFWVLGLSSHSGQQIHIDGLARLAQVAKANEEELFCPRTFSLDINEATKQRLANEKPNRLNHPCSGKHLLMLAACREHGFSTHDYWNEDHPIQKKIASLVGQQIGEKPTWVQDSCGLPTVAMSAKAHLSMWQRLALDGDEKTRKLRTLWTSNSRLVGGYDRLDSDIMDAVPGQIIAKEGADGLLIVQSVGKEKSECVGCLIKLDSGYNSSYLALALWATLNRFPDLPEPYPTLKSYLKARLEKWVPRDQQLVIP
jgi:L-asparaginase II